MAGGICLFAFNHSYAQIGKEYSIKPVKEFIADLKDTVKVNGGKKRVSLPVNTGFAFSALEDNAMQQHDGIYSCGQIEGEEFSTYTLRQYKDSLAGEIILLKKKKAYRYYTVKGELKVKEVDINHVICLDYKSKAAKEESQKRIEAAPAGSWVYNLQSFPGAQAVVMLDFDGHYANSYWNAKNNGSPVNAAPANFTEYDINKIFESISEDFAPFNLNITTNEAVYQAAPANRRMRCIFTPTDFYRTDAGNPVAGVAASTKFTSGGDYYPCWVFDSDVRGAYEAGSHEIGHTLWLNHHGLYAQESHLGTTEWGPIMGHGEFSRYSQWSKGDYSGATNPTQDDLNIIATKNGFGYRTDEPDRTLTLDNNGNIVGNNKGVISTREDTDAYTFLFDYETEHVIKIKTNNIKPNLNLQASIYRNGILLTSWQVLYGEIYQSYTQQAGNVYTIVLEGIGDPANYTDYGSLGYYTITGTIKKTCTQYEVNDTKAQAVIINPNKSIYGKIRTASDVDWYKITTTSAEPNIQFNLTDLVRDYDMELYNKYGALINYSYNGNASAESIIWESAVPEDYYVKINGYSGAYGEECYRFTSKTMQCYDSETSNTMQRALPIPVNTDKFATLVNSADEDWFKFSNSSANPNIQVLLAYLLEDHNLELYNSAGTKIGSSYSSSSYHQQINYNTSLVGNYYIKVSRFSGSFIGRCYRITAYTSSTALRREVEVQYVEQITSNNSVITYPNPAKTDQQLIVERSISSDLPVVLKIVNMEGRVVFDKTVLFENNKATIELERIVAGVYILELEGLERQKLVIY